MAAPRGQQRLAHRGQGIRGAAWALRHDALLELRLGAHGHRGVAVRVDSPRGLLIPSVSLRWLGAASCSADCPSDGHRGSLKSAVAGEAGRRGRAVGCWVVDWRQTGGWPSLVC